MFESFGAASSRAARLDSYNLLNYFTKVKKKFHGCTLGTTFKFLSMISNDSLSKKEMEMFANIVELQYRIIDNNARLLGYYNNNE